MKKLTIFAFCFTLICAFLTPAHAFTKQELQKEITQQVRQQTQQPQNLPNNWEDQLLNAALKGDLVSLKKIMDAGVDPNFFNSYDGATVLIYASRYPKLVKELLYTYNASPTKADKVGVTPLMGAALYGNIESMQLLLNKIPEKAKRVNYVNAKDYRSWTALSNAADAKDVKAFEFLLAQGAKPQGPALARVLNRVNRMENKPADREKMLDALRKYKIID